MAKGFKKKNSKGGHDFIPTDKKTVRSSEPSTEVNIEIDNNSEEFSEGVRKDFESHDIDMDGEHGYWRLHKEGDNYRLSLHDPMGWMWNGDESSLLGFMVRMAGSDEFNDFKKKAEENGLTFNDLKKKLLENTNDPDFMYEITGDNNEWKFGGDEVDTSSELDYFEEHYNLTDEQIDKISNNLWTHYTSNYDDFINNGNSSNIKSEFKDKLKNANSFDDFEDIFDNNFIYDIRESVWNYKNEKLSDAIHKTLDDMGIKEPE